MQLQDMRREHATLQNCYRLTVTVSLLSVWEGMEELPVEFLKRPLPLVALLGHTALHPSIAKLFSPAGFRDEPDAPSLATLSFELDVNQLPKRKPKRTSYENYTPPGIIKVAQASCSFVRSRARRSRGCISI